MRSVYNRGDIVAWNENSKFPALNSVCGGDKITVTTWCHKISIIYLL